MRLIDADALMKEFAKFVAPSNNSDFIAAPTWNDAVSLVGSAPTATQSNDSNALGVLERKKGKWEFVGLQMFVCSECKHGFRQDWLMDWRTNNSEPIFPNFCPNCGAEME